MLVKGVAAYRRKLAASESRVHGLEEDRRTSRDAFEVRIMPIERGLLLSVFVIYLLSKCLCEISMVASRATLIHPGFLTRLGELRELFLFKS